jgi:hypothetical protein
MYLMVQIHMVGFVCVLRTMFRIPHSTGQIVQMFVLLVLRSSIMPLHFFGQVSIELGVRIS